MKPYFSVKQGRHAIIVIPGNHKLIVDVAKAGPKQFSAVFLVEEMELTRNQVRAFITACKMAMKFVEKFGISSPKGGGGRIPYEYNDELHHFYFDKYLSKEITYDGHRYYIPAGLLTETGTLRRYQKVAQRALQFRILRPLRFLYNKRLGGW